MHLQRILLFPILLALFYNAKAQSNTLTGRITDAVTAEALPFCHVFVNRTTLGTTTDEKGMFVLKNIPDPQAEIIVTYVGYQTYQRSVTFTSDVFDLSIRLQPESQQLTEVQVKTNRDKTWESQLDRFEDLFFGKSPFKEKCELKNPWVLEFEELRNAGNTTLRARASEPLQIENRALGYRVTYYLDLFESNSEEIKLRGNVQFQTLMTLSDQEEKRWFENRLNAYLGSTRHFLKSFLANTQASAGFLVYYPKKTGPEAKIRSNRFAAELDKTLSQYESGNLVQPGIRKNQHRLIIPTQLEIHYTQKQAPPVVYQDVFYPVSWLESTGGPIELTQEGVVLNPDRLIVSGAMLNKRVADMLPHDYRPDEALIPRVERVASVKINPLEERTYIHTDKPYYYPGERIWFKAYLNYRDRSRKDSLSRVLYVDWISTDKEILETITLPIENGASSGSFLLPEKLQPGTYFLHSYTNWMNNFTLDYANIKVVPVLNLFEQPIPDSSADQISEETARLTIRSAQTAYKPKSLISLDLYLTDSNGQPLSGDLSISVTDQGQVIAVNGFSNAQNLLRQFPFPTSSALSRTLGSLTFPIEYGLSVQGHYLQGGKKTKAAFAVVQGKMDNMAIAETNDLGAFWITGFQFNDTTEIAFRHVNNKTTRAKMDFIPRHVPDIGPLPAVAVPATIKASVPQRQELFYKLGRDARLLDEVAVSARRIELAKNLMGDTDFKISPKEVMQASSTNLLDALAARVPGLVVIGDQIVFADAFSSTFGTPPAPLLIIDGYQTNDGVALLRQINPALVEGIEVVKYGAAAMFGVRAAGGVIIIQTRQGGLDNLKTEFKTFNDKFFAKKKLVGYTSAALVPFRSPDYRNPEDSGVDYRSTIYWNPRVRLHESGKTTLEFFASDEEAEYQVVIEGVTDQGLPVRATTTINVQR